MSESGSFRTSLWYRDQYRDQYRDPAEEAARFDTALIPSSRVLTATQPDPGKRAFAIELSQPTV